MQLRHSFFIVQSTSHAVLRAGLLLCAMVLPVAAFAHGGEDHSHGDEAASPAAPNLSAGGGVRLELQSSDVELLGIVLDGKLTLYVDRFSTNEPIPDATVELESKGKKLVMKANANGIAEGDAGWLADPGRYEVLATVQAKGLNDLLVGIWQIPDPNADGGPESRPWWRFWGSLLEKTLLPKMAFAHGGEEHSHGGGAAATPPLAGSGNKPARLPDGSLFLPKPVQRLLAIRTTLSMPQTLALTVQLNGVVVTDPNASATVQPLMSGQLLAPEGGFPSIGSRVEKGAVLAILEPAASNTDKGDQQDKIAELRSLLGLAEKKAERLTSIAGLVSEMDVDAARNESDVLKARLQALQGSLAQQPETLRAPLAGIISTANVMLGQQANAGDKLFTIIDPSRLQVEALTYDPGLAWRIGGASAMIEGQRVALEFVGASQQLRNQALPLRFRVKASPLVMSVGQPVKVAVQTKQQIKGVPLPAASLVHDGQMEPVLWVKTSAERFTPHKVKSQPLDVDTLAVLEGLPAGRVRVVTQGAALLGQVR